MLQVSRYFRNTTFPGLITFDSLRNVSVELGLDISDDEIKGMILEADFDRDGAVNENEFVEILKSYSILLSFECIPVAVV